MHHSPPSVLQEKAPAIKSVDILGRWGVWIVGTLIAGALFSFKLRLDVDAHHEVLIEHGSSLKLLERSDAIKSERLESMLKLLEKIDRKLNP